MDLLVGDMLIFPTLDAAHHYRIYVRGNCGTIVQFLLHLL